MAYLAPYLPRNGDGGLVIYDDDEELGGGKVRRLEDEGVTLVNEETPVTTPRDNTVEVEEEEDEEEFQGVVPGDQDDSEKLVAKSSSKMKVPNLSKDRSLDRL